MTGAATQADVVLVASFGDAVAVDYAAFVSQAFARECHRRRR